MLKGAGRHVWSLTAVEVIHVSRFVFFNSIISLLGIWAAKVSIILLYARIFSTNDKIFRRCLYGAFITTTLVNVTIISLILASCRPVSFFWEKAGGEGEGACIDISAGSIASATFNVAVDSFLLILPVPKIMKLQMPLRRRLTVVAVFLLGGVACALGMVRLYLVATTEEPQLDFTWFLGPVSLFWALDPALVVMASCMPSLLPLWSWTVEKIRIIRGKRGHKAPVRKEAGTCKIGLSTHLNRYIENGLVLRPKQEDEMRLTTLVTRASVNGSRDSMHGQNTIAVKSEVTQTVELTEWCHQQANAPSAHVSLVNVK
ncbi:unnamed protein product [Discula destructiva]